MKLQQGQRWKTADQTVRIVKLERMAVDYKVIPEEVPDVDPVEGVRHSVTKKEFCRLIKGAVELASDK